MKIKMLSRNPDLYTRETVHDIHRIPRNYNPTLHPFQADREYTRAINYTKLEKVFAKPFLSALTGHTDGVNTMAKHPTSLSTIVSGSADGEVIFWNVAIRGALRSVNAHHGAVNGVSFSPCGNVVTSVGTDCTIKHWSVNPPSVLPEEPVSMASYKGAFSSVHHQQTGNGKRGFFATSSGHVVDIWDHDRSQPINTYKWDVSTMHHVKWNPIEQDILASLDSEHNILLHDIRKSTAVRKLRLKMTSNSLSWNPIEPFVFTVANDDYNCYTFDTRRLDSAMYVHKDHILAVMDVDYSPTGQEFATAGFDKTVRIFKHMETRSHELYHTKRMQRIHSVKWSLDDRYILSGSEEMNIRLWKARASEKLGLSRRRQNESREYSEKLMAKYANHPQVKRIARHRHLPGYVKFQSKQLTEIRDARRRKEQNVRRHRKDTEIVPEKRRYIDSVE